MKTKLTAKLVKKQTQGEHLSNSEMLILFGFYAELLSSTMKLGPEFDLFLREISRRYLAICSSMRGRKNNGTTFFDQTLKLLEKKIKSL